MLPLLAPILAQLVTLSVGDRTEARYVVSDDSHAEGATRPAIGLNFGWKRSSLSIAYTPSFLVTPLEHKPRDLLIFQGAAVSASYHWRKTAVSISEGVGYGAITFQVRALADPGTAAPAPTGVVPDPGTGTTPTPTPGGAQGGTQPGSATGTGAPTTTTNPQATNQIRINNQVIHYAVSSTALSIGHTVSRYVATGGDASYTVAGGVGDSKGAAYPLIKGVHLGAFISHIMNFGRNDSIGSSLSAQYGQSSLDNRVFTVTETEGWSHRLSMRTTTRLSGGISGTRFSTSDGTIGYSIYPTFGAGIAYTDRLAAGVLVLSANASGAPYLDPLRATVDPRLGIGANAAWSKKRFSIGAGAGAAISLASDNSQANGAINSVGASLGLAYFLGSGFSADAGASTGWQTFQGATIIPASGVVFAGVSWNAAVPLSGH